MDQEQYDMIFSYIRTGQLQASSLSKSKKDSLRRKGKSFLVKSDGLLYFTDKKNKVDLQVIDICMHALSDAIAVASYIARYCACTTVLFSNTLISCI